MTHEPHTPAPDQVSGLTERAAQAGKPSLDDLWRHRISYVRSRTGATIAEIEASLSMDLGFMTWKEVQRLRAALTAAEGELHLMKTAGIIEVAIRNPSVSDYMQHWQARAEAAEAQLAERDAAIAAAYEAAAGLVHRIADGYSRSRDKELSSALYLSQVQVRALASNPEALRRIVEGGND